MSIPKIKLNQLIDDSLIDIEHVLSDGRANSCKATVIEMFEIKKYCDRIFKCEKSYAYHLKICHIKQSKNAFNCSKCSNCTTSWIQFRKHSNKHKKQLNKCLNENTLSSILADALDPPRSRN
jgi:hypothetical protein